MRRKFGDITEFASTTDEGITNSPASPLRSLCTRLLSDQDLPRGSGIIPS